MNKLTIVSVPEGDWEGLYVNGELKHEEHKIQIEYLAHFCPIQNINRFYYEDFCENNGFPSSLKEVLEEKAKGET